MKEKVTFSIDEEIMQMARENIPNMSGFIEECFKAYLMMASMDEEYRGEKLREAWNKFRESQLEIHMLTNIDYEKQNIDKMQEKIKTDAWLQVWGDYRKNGSVQDFKIEESDKILKIGTDILRQLLQDTYFEAKQDMTKLYIYDNWSYIEENILPHVEVEEEEVDIDDILDGKVDIDEL